MKRLYQNIIFASIGMGIGVVSILGLNHLNKTDYRLRIYQEQGVYRTLAEGNEHWSGTYDYTKNGKATFRDILAWYSIFDKESDHKEIQVLSGIDPSTPVSEIELRIKFQR